jgi:hypothetical protein
METAENQDVIQPVPIPMNGLELPPLTETADLVTLFVSYALSDECRGENKKPDWNKVASAMGWERQQLDQFRHNNAHLIACAEEMVLTKLPKVKPPTDAELLGADADSLEVRPTDQQLAQAIALSEQNLQKGLRSLGLNESEVSLAQAQQEFNKTHFKESMDMISSGLLTTALKLQTQQREIEERVAFVRGLIREFGEFQSEDRSAWIKEENLLMMQYKELGDLLNRIQETWYRGAAFLAVIRSRLRGETGANGRYGLEGRTQRSNKPGFRPSVIINETEAS